MHGDASCDNFYYFNPTPLGFIGGIFENRWITLFGFLYKGNVPSRYFPFNLTAILSFRYINAIKPGMVVKQRILIRQVNDQDYHDLVNLIHFESHVHRHLDFCPPLEWIGQRPFLVAEQDDEIVAALACPPDPDFVAWMRLFVVSSTGQEEGLWSALWSEAKTQLENMAGLKWVAGIPLRRWFAELLREAGFEEVVRVVVLEHSCSIITPQVSQSVDIRAMNLEDLDEVHTIDMAAFSPVWIYSRQAIERAFQKAAWATVAVAAGKPVGYQISTTSPVGGHLARLAVLPKFQHQGIGFALVQNMLSFFNHQGAHKVTVNTQSDNLASLVLYRKAGFQRTGEEYPLYLQSITTQA